MRKTFWVFLAVMAMAITAYASDPWAGYPDQALLDMGFLETGPVAEQPEPMPGFTDVLVWTALPDMAVTLNRAAIGKIGNYIYVFGGQGSGGGSTAQAFNITTEQWVPSNPPAITGSNWCATVVGDSVLYLYPKGGTSSEIQTFTPTAGGPTGTWSLAAMYPLLNAAQAVAWDGGNYIYSAGGNNTPYSPLAFRLNLTTLTFDNLPPLPEGRAYCGGACVNGKFYVMDGSDPAYNYTNTCFEYDPVTNLWTTKAPMIVPLSFSCFDIACDGSKIYLVGGGGGNAASLPSTDTVQVYDPATDTWTLETNRMNNYGTNSACYVPQGNYLFDCGGRIMTTSYRCTWKGVMQTSSVDVTVTPVNPPIVIPATGGTFQFRANLRNTTTNPLTFEIWVKWRYPDGSWTFTLGPFSLTLPGNANITRVRNQNVSAASPAGTYTLVGYAGPYPAIFDSSYFDFTKSATDMGGEWVYNNDNWGEEFDMEIEAAPSQFELLGNFPNPFNPTTAISYQLLGDSQVSLRVYDTAGREVATLVDGWRAAGTHQVTFDAAGLPSGVYLYRLSANGQTAVSKMVLMK